MRHDERQAFLNDGYNNGYSVADFAVRTKTPPALFIYLLVICLSTPRLI